MRTTKMQWWSHRSTHWLHVVLHARKGGDTSAPQAAV